MSAAGVDAATPPRAAAAGSAPFKDADVEGMPTTFDFDFIVIGGGSGGLAAAKAAADLGAKVALCDFVTPSTQNSTWGLGGTCVNVGCIPKKLMHTAGLFGEHFRHSVSAYGWKVGGLLGGLSGGGGGEDEYDDGTTKPLDVKCDWETLRNNVEMHIRSLNFGYVATCRKKDITYVNGYATFTDRWTVETKDRRGAVKSYTARRFLIATGGRPTVPHDVEGALEHAVTSDDIFRLRREPGRTLVVGASYVALECAGFLTGIGREATVLMRSIPLRGFDQQSANLVVNAMEKFGTRVLRGAVPVRLSKDHKGGPEDERITVTYRVTGPGGRTFDDTEDYDTVLFATGRAPESKKIGIAAAGVTVNPKSDRIIVDDHDRTVVSNIYCIGDVAEGRPELTPVAIQAGRLLAARLYGGSPRLMAYHLVPTTVFTPLEYGCVGYSEEKAVELFGEDSLEIYHSFFTPLEWSVPHMGENMCYMKLICNLRDSERVIGFHVISPNAGEITQGVAIAMRAGATKEQFDETIGIHPTVAEEMTILEVTKRSGRTAEKEGC